MMLLLVLMTICLGLACARHNSSVASSRPFVPRDDCSGDPCPEWFAYARFDADNHNSKITQMNCSWIVPEDLGARQYDKADFAPWFGIQTYEGKGALIQPILDNSGRKGAWQINHEVYDWTNKRDHQTPAHTVPSGDKITSSLMYRANDNSYDMYITSAHLGRTFTYNYKLLAAQKANEATAYFVLELQPKKCKDIVQSGSITFTNISLEVDGTLVASPKWQVLTKQPDCNTQAVLVDSNTIKIQWAPSADIASIVI